ncbi:MAG: hypothetical protein ACI9VR_002881 [Cognaticolwellia sp.]|jgi:hypothetical protein
MSSEYSVYVRGDAESLVRIAESFLGCSFESPLENCVGVRHADVCEVSITFEDMHRLVDDMGILFSEYPVSISFSRSGGQAEPELRETLCQVLALLFGRLVASRGYGDTMVVRDCQWVIERREREIGQVK